MLVLTRQVDESIELWLEDGRVIVVEVVDIRSGEHGGERRCRIGVTADKGVGIHRSEVAAAIRREAAPGFPARQPCRNVPIQGSTGRP